MNPPVEAPTSRHRRPSTSTPKGCQGPLELLTAARGVAPPGAHVHLDVRSDEHPGLRGYGVRCGPTRTSPAITAAAARLREFVHPALGEQRVQPAFLLHETKGTGERVCERASHRNRGRRVTTNSDMTLARLVPLPIHAALEVALASMWSQCPSRSDSKRPRCVVAVVIGVLMMGAGLAAATQGSGRSGPGALRVSAHADVDLGLALASALAGLIFAIGGDVGAAGLFVAAAAARGCWRSPRATARGRSDVTKEVSAHTSQ